MHCGRQSPLHCHPSTFIRIRIRDWRMITNRAVESHHELECDGATQGRYKNAIPNSRSQYLSNTSPAGKSLDAISIVLATGN